MSTASQADTLEAAERSREAVAPLTGTAELSEPAAYAVQEELVARRVRTGHRIVGVKLAFTSPAKQRMLGISEPAFGWLTADMAVQAERLDLAAFIHPRVEPEIAVRLAHPLRGPGVTPADVAAATSTVFAALDVVDSRFRDYRFTAADNIADRAAGGAWTGGEEQALTRPALAERRVTLYRDGDQVAEAVGADAMGDPLAAVAWLANRLAAHPRGLRAGDVVLTGGLTESFALEAGRHFSARVDGLGPVALTAG